MVAPDILWFALLFLAIFDRCGESGPGPGVLRSAVHRFSRWLCRLIERWGCSSAGRAPALQAGGQRFDPAQLHHSIGVEMSDILERK